MTVEYFYRPFRRCRLSDLGTTLKEKGGHKNIGHKKNNFRVAIAIRKNAFGQFCCGLVSC